MFVVEVLGYVLDVSSVSTQPFRVVNSSGYVGIGTTNPQAALDVNGGLKFNSITMNGVYYCKIGTGSSTGYGSTLSSPTNVNIPTAIRTSSVASFDGTNITFNNTGYYNVNLQLNLVSLSTPTYIALFSVTGANVTVVSIVYRLQDRHL